MGSKPFVPPSDSRLQAAPADLAKALGLNDLEDEQELEPSVDLAAEQKANEEAEKVIQSREARIQEKSEQLYRTEERLALKDPDYLKTLANSTDAEDRKLAGKILKRNADTFGASTIEDYRLAVEKSSTSDPTEQKLMELDYKTNALDKKQKDSEWSEWKKANSVTDIADVADDIRATYPDMSYGDVLAMARGREGLTQTTSRKASGNTAFGGSGAPETEESVYMSPLAKKMLKNPDSTMKFAKGYLRSLNS